MSTATHKKMSVEEFWEFAASHGRCELINGEVIEMSPAGARHGRLVGRIHGLLFTYIAPRKLGELFAAETGFIIDPKGPKVRAPDVAYIRSELAKKVDVDGFAIFAPDLIVEVLSPVDRMHEVNKKISQWLAFGVAIVWVVDPENRTVTTYQPGGASRVYSAGESVPGEPALAGFSLAVNEMFE